MAPPWIAWICNQLVGQYSEYTQRVSNVVGACQIELQADQRVVRV